MSKKTRALLAALFVVGWAAWVYVFYRMVA